MYSLGALDPVTITPVTPGIRHIVVDNKFIHGGDQIEVPLPGDVIGLKNGYFFQNSPLIYKKIVPAGRQVSDCIIHLPVELFCLYTKMCNGYGKFTKDIFFLILCQPINLQCFDIANGIQTFLF